MTLPEWTTQREDVMSFMRSRPLGPLGETCKVRALIGRLKLALGPDLGAFARSLGTPWRCFATVWKSRPDGPPRGETTLNERAFLRWLESERAERLKAIPLPKRKDAS